MTNLAHKASITLVTAYNPHDISRWSGTVASLYRAVKNNHHDLPVDYTRGLLGVFDWLARFINKLLKLSTGLVLDCRFSTLYAMVTGGYLTLVLALRRPGALLVIAGSNWVPYLRTKRTIIYVSDATVAAIFRTNPWFNAFPAWLKRQADNNERRSLTKATYALYPSKWASDSAQRDYAVPVSAIREIPFGPNLRPELLALYNSAVERKVRTPRPPGPLKLIYVSTDWELKNGDLVVETARLLSRFFKDLELTMIGEVPNYARQHPFVKVHSFVDKSSTFGVLQMCAAYLDADLLLHPTTAEAFGIVISEAQAFGVPTIAFDVGGVRSAVVQGKTGFVYPTTTPAVVMADDIRRIFANQAFYLELSRNCRRRFEEQANWKTWSDLIAELAMGTRK